MEILPYNFDPQRTLSPMERYKVEFYYQRFVVERYREYGDGHFLLACYAALPVLMTPDLLYKLWLNFSDYNDGSRPQRINRLAVADLLLSPMFSEIGQETFEMSNPLRNALLAWWQEEKRSGKWLRLPDLEEVAWFLLDYLKTYSTRNSAADQAFREAQEWMALSYVEPQSAYRQLVKALAEASNKAKASPDDQSALAEKLRLMETIGRMEQRYKLELKEEAAQVPTGFNMLAGYAGAMKNQLAGMDAGNLLEGVDISSMRHMLSEQASDTAISFPVPERMLGEVKSEEEDGKASKLYVLLIGIDEYQNHNRKLNSVRDLKLLSAAIEGIFDNEIIMNELLASNASNENIFSKISEINSLTRPNDIFLIAFVGLSTNVINKSEATKTILLTADFQGEKTRDWGGIELTQLIGYLTKKGGQIPYTYLLVDIVDGIYPINDEEKFVIIKASGLDLPGGSPFFNDFIAIWQQSKGRLSLQKMMAVLVERQNSGANTNYGAYSTSTIVENIGLYAFPAMAARPFLAPENPVLDMQYLLRDLGLYNGSANGVYNKATDEALQSIFRQQETPLPENPVEVVNELRKISTARKQGQLPLYLFVFADPNSQFPAIKSEQEAIHQSLEKLASARKAEVVMLNDPSREDIKRYFVDPSYRGRMAIFHFAGNEDKTGQTNGLMLNGQEVVSFNDLNNWIDFQDDLRLCFLNTCNNAKLAELLTLRGVGAAIGTPSNISDDYAGNFAQQFYENMAEGMGLEEAFNAVDVPQSGYGSHRSAAPEPSYEEPGIHRLFLNWGKAGEMREWRIAEKKEIKQRRGGTKKTRPEPQTEEAPVFEGYERTVPASNMEITQEPQSQYITDRATDQIKNLIAKGETEKAIEMLLQLTEREAYLKPLNKAAQNLSEQFIELKGKELRRTISYENAQVEHNQIVYTLLGLIEEVETGKSKASPEAEKPSLWRRFLNNLGNIGGS